jgi:hypothetical protein
MGNIVSEHDCCWGGSSGQQKKPGAILETPTTRHYGRDVKLLFGCQTEEEHYDYVKEMCEAIATKHGEEGLQVLGFEYRFYHNPKTCKCDHFSQTINQSSMQGQDEQRIRPEEEKKSSEEKQLIAEKQYLYTISDVSINDESQKDFTADRKKTTKSRPQFQQVISDLSFGESDESDDKESQDDSVSDDERHISRGFRELSIQENEFVVPIGEPLSRASSMNDLTNPFGVRMGSERSMLTSTTMFSLATHHSRNSSITSDENSGEDCSLRLFHKSSNTLMTEKNHELFVAHGKMYDEVVRLCMEYAQDVMMKEGNLEWKNMGGGVGAIVSRDRSFRKALLLVITGKGKVGAGIFSRRHLMTRGLEVSTALPFIRGAKVRNMDVALLDPNVNGSQEAMKSVKKSLERLFFEQGTTKEDVYILAHSMGGSQIARFLHDKTHLKADTKGTPTPPAADIQTGSAFLQQIKAVAFTDSNHNINWTKKNPAVTELLEGPSSLYIKSTKVHEDAKVLGELHHDCDFWKHRFGSIKTIWGGTSEHALTNYTGISYIWDHFDTFLEASGRIPEEKNTL